MTTTVTVTTHDWPAEVRAYPLDRRCPVQGGEWLLVDRVPPNSSMNFIVHDGQDLMVRELPRNNTAPPPEFDNRGPGGATD